MRYLIVGSGAAGISAAESIREYDPHGEIFMFTNEPQGYYSRPGLAYFLTGEIPEKQLYPYSKADFLSKNLKLWHSEIRQIKPDQHLVVLNSGNAVRYDRLLIATGSTAVKPDLQGIDLQGVVKLDTLHDAREILRRIRKTNSAVVVGGGITALEIVEGFLARKIRTHYFLRKGHYWSNVLDAMESQIVLERLTHDGVRIHKNTELEEILGKKGRVTAVRTADHSTITCELVAIAIGVRPNIQFTDGIGMQIDRGIVVNEKMETNLPDIFAAGDVAQYIEGGSGKGYMDVLWSIAREQGKVAGINMAGGEEIYHRALPYNVTRLAGLTTTIIGMVGNPPKDMDLITISRGDSETFREMPHAIIAQEEFDVNRIRLIMGDETILGAIIIGDQTLSTPIQKIIREKINISSIKDLLTKENADIRRIIENFWTEYRDRHATH